MTASPLSLVVVMPAYNEEGCIAGVIQSWLKVLREVPKSRLLIINDGSRDGTGRVLDDLLRSNDQLEVIHQLNGGHGAAIVVGYARALESGSDWIFQVDSDDQIVAAEFTKLWSRRAESPFILGHRRQRHDEKNRLVISAINRWLVTALFHVYLRDPNVPFRLMHRDFLAPALEIVRRRPAFAPNVQFSILARLRGLRTLDIAVRHRIRETGVASIRYFKLARVCVRCFFELIRFRLLLPADARAAN